MYSTQLERVSAELSDKVDVEMLERLKAKNHELFTSIAEHRETTTTRLNECEALSQRCLGAAQEQGEALEASGSMLTLFYAVAIIVGDLGGNDAVVHRDEA